MTRLGQLKHEECLYPLTQSTRIVIRKIQAGALQLRCIQLVTKYTVTNVKVGYAETFAIYKLDSKGIEKLDRKLANWFRREDYVEEFRSSIAFSDKLT